MAAGNAVIAHDNPYNRWVAGDGALYFTTARDAAARIGELLQNAARRAALSSAASARHAEEFTWEHVAGQYETVLQHLPPWRCTCRTCLKRTPRPRKCPSRRPACGSA